MAEPTYTLEQLSPERGAIRITKTAGGGDQSVTVSNSALLAAFAANTPLGRLVRSDVFDQAAAFLVMLGGAVASQQGVGRIMFVGQLSGVLAFPPSIIPNEDSGVIVLELTTVAGAGSWYFYIEYVNSIVR